MRNDKLRTVLVLYASGHVIAVHIHVGRAHSGCYNDRLSL